jgi:hypothetical protein
MTAFCNGMRAVVIAGCVYIRISISVMHRPFATAPGGEQVMSSANADCAPMHHDNGMGMARFAASLVSNLTRGARGAGCPCHSPHALALATAIMAMTTIPGCLFMFAPVLRFSSRGSFRPGRLPPIAATAALGFRRGRCRFN